MSELRWNPLLRTYTMVASNRQARPQMPRDWCPFCPGSGKVPEQYTTYVYPNDFPALSKTPPEPDLESEGVYEVAEAYGVCEVILFSPDHNASLHSLPLPHLEEIVRLWQDRVRVHEQDPRIKYVFEFENRGEEVGVTMPHPHGQLYGYPFIPQKLAVEYASCREHYQQHGTDLIGDMNRQELEFGKRMVIEGRHFLAYLPFFTDYPYGLFLTARRNVSRIDHLNDEEVAELALMLKEITGLFDTLFNRPFPYMMCLHQAPLNSPEWAGSEDWYRFHIEFYPPLRDASRIKYYAGSEMGAWAAANTRAVEETAEELRHALQRFRESGSVVPAPSGK